MRKLGLVSILSLLFLSSEAFCASSSNSITGNWKGTLQVGQTKLRLMFKITQLANGPLMAKLDSVDQGAHDLPVDSVNFKDGKVRMEVKFIQGDYEGLLDKTGNKLIGKWQQGGQTFPLDLERAAGTGQEEDVEPLSAADVSASKQAAQKFAGDWKGVITAGTTTFPLVLKINKNSQGMAAGSLDSPDQGLKGIPLSGVLYKDGQLKFVAQGLGASYQGVSFNDGTSITGQWHQASQTLPLNFRKETSK